MRKSGVLSTVLGLALAVGAVAPAFAQTSGTQTGAGSGQAEARQEILAFCTWTGQHWSAEGYSSVADMRNALGESQSGWWTETLHMAGMSSCPSGPVASSQTTPPTQPSPGTQTTQPNPGTQTTQTTTTQQGGQSSSSQSR